MSLILISIFFAIVSMIVANNKNRSGVLWFFLGLFFSIFAFVLVLILPKINNKSEIKQNVSNKPSVLDDFFKDKRSYLYQIKIKEKTETWNAIRQDIFEHLEDEYKLKRNDTEEIFFEITKNSYIRVFSKLIDHRLFYCVESIGYGKLYFSEDLEIITEEEYKIDGNDKEQTDTVDKLSKISELLEKGHLTNEEFEIQKKRILNI